MFLGVWGYVLGFFGGCLVAFFVVFCQDLVGKIGFIKLYLKRINDIIFIF